MDLAADSGNEITLMEIKSAGTVRKEFFKGLEYFHQFIKPAGKRILVYDGDRDEERSTGFVTHPARLVFRLEGE